MLGKIKKWINSSHGLLRNTSKADGLFFITVSLLGLSLGFSILAFGRIALAQFVRPVLWLDDWSYATHRPPLLEWPNILRWLVSQHAEHRPMVPRILTMVETEILKLPPLSTALIQSLALLLLASGLVAWIAALLLPRRRSVLLAWLACSVILFNPWQKEVFCWAATGPFVICSTLMLAATLLFVGLSTGRNPAWRKCCLTGVVVLPWLGIFTQGQGFALAGTMFLACLFHSRILAAVSLASSGAAAFTYYRLLPYVKPAHHPAFGFDPNFMASLLRGGNWPGMGVLCLALLVFCIVEAIGLKSKGGRFNTRILMSLAMPGTFAILSALMITVSRSKLGVGGAEASWYVTILMMLPISGVLIASWIHDKVRITTSPVNWGGRCINSGGTGAFDNGFFISSGGDGERIFVSAGLGAS